MPDLVDTGGSELDQALLKIKAWVSNLEHSESLEIELEGFAVGCALCNVDAKTEVLTLETLSGLLDSDGDERLLEAVAGLVRIASEELGRGSLSFPSHLWRSRCDGKDDSDIEADNYLSTLLFVDGMISAGRTCPYGWPKRLFQLNNSSDYIAIFAFMEDELGNPVIDAEGRMLEAYRRAYISSLPTAIIRLYASLL
jgi:hypothetical protein